MSSAATLTLDDLLLEQEWRRCAPDWETSSVEEKVEAFTYWCSNYVYIRHPSKGRIAFDLREAQIETVEVWLEERYSLVLKARQIGFSTLVSVFALWLTFFYDDRTVIMLSKTERDAAKLLQHAKYAHRFLPEWMKLRGPIPRMNQTQVAWTNESIIESLPSASDPARGVTAFLIVVDEIGFLPNSEEAWAAIEPVADVGGRVIMLGTANGEGNLFHRLWVGSQTGDNRFKGIFHPWWASGRSDDWYEFQKKELPAWQLAQEYPSNPDEAFLKSGNPVFDLEVLRAIVPAVPLASGHVVDYGAGVEFEDGGGPLRVWEFPKPKATYVVGADVAEGLEHGDFSVAHVIDARTKKVVATWHGHVDPDLFGEEVLNRLGRWYNNALMGVEVNNHGLTTLKALQRAGYRRIYRQHREGSRFKKPTENLGWRTTASTKPLAIDELNRELRGQSLSILDESTLAELRTFVREGDGKMHGSPHDDRVMALAIAVQMLKYVWLPEYRLDEKPPPGTAGWLVAHLFEEEPRRRKPIGSHNRRRRENALTM